MHRFHQALFVASLIALPLASHAVDAAPLTRAEVRADLIQAERLGQVPQSQAHYPDADANGATAYVANKAVIDPAGEASYGPSTSGKSASGVRGWFARITAGARPSVTNIYQGG